MTELAVTETKLRNYMDEDKARALVLFQQGHTIDQIADEVGCSRTTAWRWEQRFRAVDQSVDGPLLMDDWTRIARRSQQKMHDMLDYLDEHPDQIAKHALIPNIYAGTGTDKIMKQPEKSNTPNITINVTIQPKPTIEAEYTVVEEVNDA